jgi:hypothetical protein
MDFSGNCPTVEISTHVDTFFTNNKSMIYNAKFSRRFLGQPESACVRVCLL